MTGVGGVIAIVALVFLALTAYVLGRKYCPQCLRPFAIFPTDEPNRSHSPSWRCWKCWRLSKRGKR